MLKEAAQGNQLALEAIALQGISCRVFRNSFFSLICLFLLCRIRPARKLYYKTWGHLLQTGSEEVVSLPQFDS